MTRKDYDSRLYSKRELENRCVRCGRPRDGNKKTCSECLRERSERYRKSIIKTWSEGQYNG